MTEENLQAAVKKFEELVREQSARSDRIKAEKEFLDFEALDKIIIGVCGGDGIGTPSVKLGLINKTKDTTNRIKESRIP